MDGFSDSCQCIHGGNHSLAIHCSLGKLVGLHGKACSVCMLTVALLGYKVCCSAPAVQETLTFKQNQILHLAID